MDKAREIIREALILNVTRSPTTKTNAVLEALQSAGYRLVGPGEVDAETLSVADRWLSNQYGIAPLVADAPHIRALGEKQDRPQPPKDSP